jgi:hypothetical protein
MDDVLWTSKFQFPYSDFLVKYVKLSFLSLFSFKFFQNMLFVIEMEHTQ